MKLNGTVGGTEELYAGQGQSDSFAPSVNLVANLEAIEKFFFVDATANVSETFISPFGAQPANLTTPSNNRYIVADLQRQPLPQGGDRARHLLLPARRQRLDAVGDLRQLLGQGAHHLLNNLNGQMSSCSAMAAAGRCNTPARPTTTAFITDNYIIQVGRAHRLLRGGPATDRVAVAAATRATNSRP